MSRRSPCDLIVAENLINCFLREGGLFSLLNETQLQIPLGSAENSGSSLIVTFEKQFALNDVRLSRSIQMQHSDKLNAPLELTPVEVMRHIASEILQQNMHHSERKPDWLENFKSSLNVSRLIFEWTSGRTATADLADFVSSEQSLTIGHRFHPSPKSRIGFTDEDLRLYSPELKVAFPLRYFGIHKQLVTQIGDCFELENWSDFTSNFIPQNDEMIVLPVHPWQAMRAIETSEFQDAARAGLVKDWGSRGPNFFPLASVRTLYQPEEDIFVKSSLDVRITNCFRPNLLPEMKASFALTQLIDKNEFDLPSFKIARERLSLDTKISDSVHLGTIFREGLWSTVGRTLRPSECILLAASLFGDREHSAGRLGVIIGHDKHEVMTWFRDYCEILVPAVLSYYALGLMFEPHLQNILVILDGGKPTQILQRDLDNAKVVSGSEIELEARSLGLPESAFFDEDTAWKRLNYCLFVNHLSEAVSTLSLLLNRSEAESELWAVVCDSLAHPLVPKSLRQRLKTQPHLFVKRNLLTRLTRGEDSRAPFAKLPNPLSVLKQT